MAEGTGDFQKEHVMQEPVASMEKDQVTWEARQRCGQGSE